MRPSARLSAAIEVLDRYLTGTPAERALTNWARGARYAGSGDRAAIRDIVFDCLRRKASYASRAGGCTGRGLVAAHLMETDSLTAVETLFDGSTHAPHSLSANETSRLQMPAEPTPSATYDLPDWLIPMFERSLGDRALAVAQTQKSRAPVFLRVNLGRMDRAAAAASLEKDGIGTLPHETVDTALRVTENPRRVAGSGLYRNGVIELQDASSQAACAALPDVGRMLDFCAGGGGKALAYGARTGAEIFAHDIDAKRMADLPERAKRAGQKVTQVDLDGCFRAAPFDLVLTDVPCSGSGTWRRAPEGKWSLTPDRLIQLSDIQAQVMDQASELLGPGGILAYMTCSVLLEENEDQRAKFLARHANFDLNFEKRFETGPNGDGFYLACFTRMVVQT